MVSKLVTLRLDGSIDIGLTVSIKISEEYQPAHVQAIGHLPANPHLIAQYHEWQKAYQSLEAQTRAIQPKAARIDSSTAAIKQRCRDLSISLRQQINLWLDNVSFNPIRRAFYQEISQSDEARILIQSDDPQLWKLPWQLWRELENYPHLEFGFSKISYRKPPIPAQKKQSRIRILAIFGDQQGIDTTVDQNQLQALPNAEVEVLHQPSLQVFSSKLWGQTWDVLFFAGHSRTANTVGYLQLNETESMTLSELQYSLRHAVRRGVQLAIFNSCDGLGLAWALDELNIPQMILMRQIVPDQVAQIFLGYFLEAYARGLSLYASVRQARDRLESLEHQFPCATWLPVICQNPATVPPTWARLQGAEVRSYSTSRYHKVLLSLGLGLGITGAVLGLRFSGLIQPMELKAYDTISNLSHSRSQPDPNILIVQVTENDLTIPQQRDRVDSLSPTALQQLMKILNRAEASVIGLSIYRDRPVTSQNLSQWVNTASPLVTTCRVKDNSISQSEVSPPANFPIEAVGFSDQLIDPDGIVRRHLIAMQPEAGRCVPTYAFSLQIALRHLAQDNISLQFLETGDWKLGKAVMKALKQHHGGYHKIDDRGMQILLRYRNPPTFERLTLAQILNGEIADQSIKGRVVLIGTTAESYRDYHSTPSEQRVAGVTLYAQMISHIIDAARGERYLVWVWQPWMDSLWIAGWILSRAFLNVYIELRIWRYLSLSVSAVSLAGLCWIIFVVWGGWIPLIPNLLGLLVVEVFTSTHRKTKT
ncbi:MAG: CHASE2 domain-containing protein [Leptolyngbya sp. Prado105]|jgi:CHASE2 domain-containing sensor protein|nr:CHASE2 domain-containing protein [Leptolyngbya sp. Prado105]